MLFSTKRSQNSSTFTSSTRSTAIKKKESFWAYIMRKCRQAFMSLWMYSRKFLWVSTTALIVIILPFAFAYFMEMQNELMKMQTMDGRFNQL